MTASHNALLGALSRHAHFSEFSEYLNVLGNILTPVQRRNLALQNLLGGSGTFTGEAGVLALPGNVLATEAATGITTGTGTIYKSAVQRVGGIFRTNILIDLTGVASVATDNDIIGVGTTLAAHFGQITAARNGTILCGSMECLETPAGGEVDLNLWSADEATGKGSDLITGLTGELTLVDRAGDWAVNDRYSIGAVVPGANQYLYLAVGTSSTPTAGTYTAGKFLIELLGYEA
jgi:hypothetical protein